ncbi:ABC transporter permease [Nannocystis pusilla]|uniref:ABC transporter permease n=1 Tax=Nannocystis pusilla TaxID=889268 RepID=UPI003B7A3ADE
MRLLRQSLLLLRSELRQELRDLELVLTSTFFTLVVLGMFYLSFAALEKKHTLPAVPGLLWLTVAFVGTITLTRAFDREREADTLRALLAAPVERLAIYVAKAGSTLLVLLVCCALLVPGLASMFPAGQVFGTCPSRQSRSWSSAASATSPSAPCSPPGWPAAAARTCCWR